MHQRTATAPFLAGAAILSILVGTPGAFGGTQVPERSPTPGAPQAPPSMTTREHTPDPAAPAGDMEDPRPDAAPQQDRPTGIRGFFRRATLSGFLDGYYTWSAGRRDPSEFRNFDVVHARLQFNLAELAVEKKAVDESRLGFRIDVGGGPATDLVNAAEPGGIDHWKALQQAYVSVLAPVNAGLTIDVGKFVTPLGAEVIEGRDNWNYSRSVLFATSIPYYHFGVRVAYPVGSSVTLSGLVVNGWNDVQDNNDARSVGVSAAFTPSARVAIVQNVMIGAEQPDNEADLRRLLNTVTIITAHPRLKLMADVVVGRDSVGSVPRRWHGAAAYLRYQATDRLAFSPRYEWYADPDGFTTGASQTLQEVTLTSELSVSDLVARLEVRTDRSDQASFATAGGPAKSRTTVAIGLMYVFSRRFQ